MSTKPPQTPASATADATREPLEPDERYSAAPEYRLFNPVAVGIAAFMGSPLAGAVCMAINYRRTGDDRRARRAILFGALGTFAVLLLSALTVDLPIPGGAFVGLNVGIAMGFRALTQQLQGPLFEEHQKLGGQVGLQGAGCLLGLAAGTVLAVAVMGWGLAEMAMQECVRHGPLEEVCLADDATRDDAQKLKAFFIDSGLFDEAQEFGVELGGDEDKTILRVWTTTGAHRKPDVVEFYANLAAELEPVLGRPVSVHMLDMLGQLKKTVDKNDHPARKGRL